MYYGYEQNGREVILWVVSGNMGKPLEECFAELDAQGISYNKDEIPVLDEVQ
jgi:hypothetical protein